MDCVFPPVGQYILRIALHSTLGCDTYSIYNDLHDIAGHKKLSSLVGHCILKDKDLAKMATSNKIYFVKTHHVPDNIPTNSKIIYLFRDGREASLSLAHYTSKFEDESLSFSDIVEGKHFFGSWHNHIDTWFNLSEDYPLNFLKIKFEDLIRSPQEHVTKILSFLNLKECKGLIPTFKQLRAINQSFFTSGKTDSWKNFIPPSDHTFFG